LIGGWGELRLGRDYTPVFWNQTVFDPFGTNGVGSSTNVTHNSAQPT
jgi:predicted porin